MKIGDYIRTDDGLIGKIVSEPYEYKDSIGHDIDFGDSNIYNEYEMYQSIIKSSPNIIDLIQVGDYVNGYLVIEKDINNELRYIDLKDRNMKYVKYLDIKSILTKEKFSCMEYKIGE